MTDLGRNNRTQVSITGRGITESDPTFEFLQAIVGKGRRNVEEESLGRPGQAVGAGINATCHQNNLPAGTTSLVRTVASSA